MKREGWPVNGKRIYKLYQELDLQLRNKTPKRKVKAKLREDRQATTGPNDIWAMELAASRRPSGPE
jgi:putative transposase